MSPWLANILQQIYYNLCIIVAIIITGKVAAIIASKGPFMRMLRATVSKEVAFAVRTCLDSDKHSATTSSILEIATTANITILKVF